MASQTISKPETEILELIERYTQAVRRKDLATIKTFYAENSVAFDMLPPLRYQDNAKYFDLWAECFGHTSGNLGYEVKDVVIKADGSIAFAYYLIHLTANGKDDSCSGETQQIDTWYRTTSCYQKINGKWKIVHEHTSVPIDVMEDKPCMDLKPE